MNLGNIQEFLGGPWALILSLFFLCASIIIHEWGHFVAARWRGLVVERFSIGFGPRIWGWKSRSGVDFRISAIPFGGYVALPQLAGAKALEGDSSCDGASLPPISPTDKIIVSIAGPLFNVLFALLLGLVIWVAGKPVDASMTTTTVGYAAREIKDIEGNWVPGPARSAGILPGDRIVAIDGAPVAQWTDIVQAVATSSGYDAAGSRSVDIELFRSVELEREGERIVLSVKPILSSGTKLREIGILPQRPAVVGGVFPNSPAEKAGLGAGDRIVSVNGEAIDHILAASRIIGQSQPVEHILGVQRGDTYMELRILPELIKDRAGNMRPMIGVSWAEEDKVLIHENPLKQLSSVVYMTFDVLKALLNPKSDVRVSDMSGPVGIVHAMLMSAREGMMLLLFLVFFININLAIVNLLPVPVLDGGHICFAILEKLRGKPLPERLVTSSQAVFVVFFLSMMAYITLHDILREFDMARTRKEIRQVEKQPDPVFGQQEAEKSAESGEAPAAAKTE